MFVQETPHLIKIEIIQTKEIEIILIIDHEITPTLDQITTITKKVPLITPGIETTTTQREENQPDPPGIDDTEKKELQSSQIHCETTNDESEPENTLLRNMLQVDNEYETTID